MKRVVLVTGACGGIGSVLCRRFVQDGATVLALDVDAAALEKLAAELGADSVTPSDGVSAFLGVQVPFARGFSFVGEFGTQFGSGNIIGTGCTNGAGANDSDFHLKLFCMSACMFGRVQMY